VVVRREALKAWVGDEGEEEEEEEVSDEERRGRERDDATGEEGVDERKGLGGSPRSLKFELALRRPDSRSTRVIP